MSHITHPPTPPPQGRGAVRLSHKSYKAYNSHKTYKTYKPSPLRGGTEGGYQYGPYYQPIWAILPTNMGHIA